MALTTTTPIAFIYLAWDTLAGHWVRIDVQTDETPVQRFTIHYNQLYGEAMEGGDILATLQDIYASTDGFRNASNEVVVATIDSLLGVPNVDGLEDAGYENPFNADTEEVIAAQDDLNRQNIFGDDQDFPIAGNTSNIQFTASSVINIITWDVVPKNKIASIDFCIEVASRFRVPVHVTREQIDGVGYVRNSEWAWSVGDAAGTPIPCVMYYGDRYTDSRREVMFRPTHFHADAARTSDTPMVLVSFRESSDGEGIIGMYVRVVTNTTTFRLKDGTITWEN